MTFSEHFASLNIDAKVAESESVTAECVAKTLAKQTFQVSDLPVLLSEAAKDSLETLAQRAHALTVQRFGRVMQLYIPLYLSNSCFNRCTYCGFSMDLDYPRKILSESEILREGKAVRDRGFAHIILLTGEDPTHAGVDYIARAIRLLSPLFSSISIEVQPFKTADYQTLIQAGADGLTLYQETYSKLTYHLIHLSGKKRNFTLRLDAPDWGGQAGFYRIGLGVLFGLSDWRFDALALAEHVAYMQREYWQVKLGVSFPRIQKMLGKYDVLFKVSDSDLTQLICAFRLVFPDIRLSLSTREPAQLRNDLLPLGITDMSAESRTDPGGYTEGGAEGQFDTSDGRSLAEIRQVLTTQGYDCVMKDFDWARV